MPAPGRAATDLHGLLSTQLQRQHMHKNAAVILPAYETKHLKTLIYDLTLPTVPAKQIHLELQQDDTAGSTTGTTLWLGGQVLAAYLASTKLTPGMAIIELGSGIGYTSLVLHALGCNVLATDLPLLVNGVLSQNMASNELRLGEHKITTCALDWTEDSPSWPAQAQRAFDAIVTSDSIYVQHLVTPLLQTIHSLCALAESKRPDVWLAYEARDTAQYDSFVQQAEQMGFKVKKVPGVKIRKSVEVLYGWKPEIYEGITVLHLKLAKQ